MAAVPGYVASRGSATMPGAGCSSPAWWAHGGWWISALRRRWLVPGPSLEGLGCRVERSVDGSAGTILARPEESSEVQHVVERLSCNSGLAGEVSANSLELCVAPSLEIAHKSSLVC
jgi:hypothetical protein